MQGYITEKRYLPIQRIQISGMESEDAHIQIGPLECFGTKKKINRRRTRTPKDSGRILKEVCVSKEVKEKLLEQADQMSNNVLKQEEEYPDTQDNLLGGEEVTVQGEYTGSSVTPKKTGDWYEDENRDEKLDEKRDEKNKPTTNTDRRRVIAADDQPNAQKLSNFDNWMNPKPSRKPDSLPRFGVMEITFVSLAGVAVMVLFVKYLLYDKLCRRNDRGELILNQIDDYSRDDHMTGTMSSAGTIPRPGDCNGCNCRRGVVTRNPINAYWV